MRCKQSVKEKKDEGEEEEDKDGGKISQQCVVILVDVLHWP